MIEAQPSRTAMRVALRRAAHQLIDGEPRVFRDPFATRIIGGAAAEELKRTPNAARRPESAAMRAWMVARSRFAEDVLTAAVARIPGPIQYLVLGAGLDTFALRNPYAGVQVFEVDHPATQAWKHEQLAAAGLHLPTNTRFVPVDFEQQGLQEQLQQTGFRFDVLTVVAWLGVVPYLTSSAFAATCRTLGGLPPGSDVIFDYGQPRAVLPPVEQLMRDSLAARVAQAGEPFQLFFTPESLERELKATGLLVREDLGSVDLNVRYFANRTDGLQTRGSSGRLCHAGVPEMPAQPSLPRE